MSSDAVLWTYALAPDVRLNRAAGRPALVTPTTVERIEPGQLELLPLLMGSGCSEAELCDRARQVHRHREDPDARCAALLFQLDRAGLLARGLRSEDRLLAWCIPLRAPAAAPATRPPEGVLRLSPRTCARRVGTVLSLEAPTGWARVEIHDRSLLPLLHDLAAGLPATAAASAVAGQSEGVILALLAMMSSCGLFDPVDDGWSPHDLWFHARTRRGYTRAWLGKLDPSQQHTPPPETPTAASASEHRERATGAERGDGAPASDGAGGSGGAKPPGNKKPRISLESPDRARLLGEDPPFAWVCEQRRSIRRYGSDAITSRQLSELLFRTLHQRDGRRPYPSGGSCYPLRCYVAVDRCRGIAPGLHAYDAVRHELITVAEPGPGVGELVADAAAAAGMTDMPQVVLVLAAKYKRTSRVYGDLSYSLILKEAGAVFQVVMMAAAAMGLGACPLGCGNALLFARLAGVNPAEEVSVGELMVGSTSERSR